MYSKPHNTWTIPLSVSIHFPSLAQAQSKIPYFPRRSSSKPQAPKPASSSSVSELPEESPTNESLSE